MTEVPPAGQPEIAVGVFLPEAATEAVEADERHEEYGEPGHAPAWGRRGRHAATVDNRVVRLGHEILQAAAEAVGQEVALVLSGVVMGMDRRQSGGRVVGPYWVDALELKCQSSGFYGSWGWR